MKIRIKNIFVNKDTKDNSKNYKSKKKENKNLSVKYRDLKLKKVYDASTIDKTDKTERIGALDTTSSDGKKVVKLRKGYIDNKGAYKNKEKDFKLKIYFDNLVKNKNKLSKGYYLLLVGMFLLGLGSVRLASKTYNLFKQEDYQVFNSVDNLESVEVMEENKEEKIIEDQSNETSNKDTITDFEKKEAEVTNNSSVKASNNTVKESSNTTKVTIKPLKFSKPIQGDILKIYSTDKVIYSKTLELWKTHDGIDIKAEEGEYVKSIEKGTVEKVYEDSFYGMTIVIDHGQGYKSSYSNLDQDTLVKEKQTLVKGQKIGKIGKTAIGEIKDETHLHFMLFKDGVSQDPTNILK